MEMVAKRVSVRGVNTPIGEFCIEFQCEPGMYRERNGTVFQWKLRPGTVRHGTDFDPERNGTVRNGTNFDPERNGLERTGLRRKIKILTPIQKMSSSQSCSHRNSVQNAPVESSTALTATLFVKIPKFDHNPKKIIITKLFAPKFYAECTDRRIHSSHGDHFHDHFCV